MTDASIRVVGTPVKFANDTSKSVVVPSGAQVGDRLVIVITSNVNATLSANPTGWTSPAGSPHINPTGNFNAIYVMYKTCTAGDPGSSVLVGNFSSVIKGVGVCLALQDSDPVTPIDVAMVSSDFNSLGTTRACPTTTSSKAGIPLLIATDRASATVAATSTWTWPSGYTQVLAQQTSASLNAGDCSLGIAVGAPVAAGAAVTPGNLVGNSLTHETISLLMIRSYTPAQTAQVQVFDDAGWHTVDLVGVGEVGVLKGVTLVDAVSGLHTPDVSTDFAGGVVSSPFTFQQGVTVDSAAADPSGTSGFGADMAPDPVTGFCTLTKADTAAPNGKAWASIKVRFRCTSLPSATNVYDNLFEIGNELTVAPKGQFTVYWNNGTLYADFNTEDATNLGLVADLNWHTLEARIYFGAASYTANIRIDGGTPIQITSAANKTPSVVGALWMGYPDTVSDYSRAIGKVSLSVADNDPGWLL